MYKYIYIYPYMCKYTVYENKELDAPTNISAMVTSVKTI